MKLYTVNKHGLIEWNGRLYRSISRAGKTVSISEAGPLHEGFKVVDDSILPIGLVDKSRNTLH